MLPAPTGPAAVHLVPEADHHRVAVGADGTAVTPEVSVVPAGGYGAQRDVVGIDLHKRDCAVRVRHAGERQLELLVPAAVIQKHVRPDADSRRESGYRLVRHRDAWFKDA